MAPPPPRPPSESACRRETDAGEAGASGSVEGPSCS